MFILQAIGVVCVAVLCIAEPPANQYLPPDKGYNYPKPQIPFSPSPSPPYQPPTNSYPSPQPPPYRPPTQQSPYQPPAPVPSYGPPSRPTPVGPPAPYPPNYTGSPTGNNGVTGFGPTDHLNQPHVPGMPFDFNYAVKDDYYGTDYSHNAVSDGDVVRGEYRVQLPDGRLQIVKYTADWATGFHADVSYEGQAQYPQGAPSAPYPSSVQQPQQAYGPPSSGSGPY